MAYKKKNPLSAERREPGGFAAIPHCLLESQVYIGLSAHAIKLLNDLMSQFKGSNNGNLCLAWTLMEKRGWKSRDTLDKARKELLNVELIEITRRGDRKKPNLYALSFFAIDGCSGKLDINPTDSPTSRWRLHEPLPSIKIRITPPPGGLNEVDITRLASNPNVPNAEYIPPAVSDQPISEML